MNALNFKGPQYVRISWRGLVIFAVRIVCVLLMIVGFFPKGGYAASAIGFVQVNSAIPQGKNTQVAATYTKGQTAGDLNVVVIGWNDSTAKISSVSDSKGNAYILAVGPMTQSGIATQAIYYGKNIVAAAANSNTVMVVFNTGANAPDLRIAEYGGIDPTNPLDVVATAQGSGTVSNSGSVTTGNANDLLVGANLVQQTTTRPGAGYTTRVITNPDADILEDAIVTTAGSFSATATLDGGAWIMQMVAFRAAGVGTSGAAPAITSTGSASFTVGAAGSFAVTAAGTPTPALMETGALPTGVTFKDNGNGTATLSGTPASSTAGTYSLTFTANNGIGTPATQAFTLTVSGTSPSITSGNSATFTGGAGTFTVTATGVPTPVLTETGALPTGVTFKDNGNGTATLGGTPASGTGGTYSLTLTASNGVGSPANQAFNLTVNLAPAITNLSQTSGPTGMSVTISGTNFGSAGTVTFSGTTATTTSWSSTSIATTVPTGATTGAVVVTVNGAASNGMNFTVTASGAAGIALVQHTSMDAGTTTSATLRFASNNTSGNWIGVWIRAGALNEAVNVWDSNGNTYRKAIQFNQTTDGLTAAMFYAENITGGANTVQISVTTSATLRFAILEYSGVMTSGSLDGAAGAQGTSSSPSVNVTTTASGDLLVGAIMTADPETFTAGSGNKIEESVPAQPNTKLIVEDAIQPSAGAASAGAVLGGGDPWAAGLAAFKAATVGGGTPPSITSGNVATFTGGAATFTVTTTGAPTPALTETGALPNGVTFKDNGNGTATLGGTPASGTSGTYPLTFTATNGIGAPATQGFTLTVNLGPVAPTITTQPSDQTATAGQTATFTVTATGAAPLSYQWLKNGANITGATSSGYTTAATTSGDNGSTFQVIVSNAAGNTPSMIATLTVTPSGGPVAAQLVQHVSSSNTRNNGFSSPYCYHYQLPNLTTAGNALVVGFTFSGNSIPAASDDQGDSFSIQVNHFDSADRQSIGIATAFNIAAGARVISVCFSSDPGSNVQPMATEFDNVIGMDGAGTGSQGTGTSVSAGSMTPTASGDLAYQVVFSLSVNQSSFTAGSQSNITWSLLSADVMDGWAAQYGLYNSTSAINPTLTMGTSQKWISAAVLLKTGTSGSVPPGMRIVHLVHENIPEHINAGGTGNPFANPTTVQFSSSGNLLVAMIGGGFFACTVTGVTDTNGNAWLQAGSTQIEAGNDAVQAYYAANATPSGNLRLTVQWTATDGDFTFFLYDVAGASSSPLDTSAGGTGSQSTAGNLTMPFTITPAGANELLFTEVIWDYNTGSGLAGQGWLFDTNTFSGESQSGPEPVDQNNGWGHLLTTGTAPVSIIWQTMYSGLPTGAWAGLAVAFKPAP